MTDTEIHAAARRAYTELGVIPLHGFWCYRLPDGAMCGCFLSAAAMGLGEQIEPLVGPEDFDTDRGGSPAAASRRIPDRYEVACRIFGRTLDWVYGVISGFDNGPREPGSLASEYDTPASIFGRRLGEAANVEFLDQPPSQPPPEPKRLSELFSLDMADEHPEDD